EHEFVRTGHVHEPGIAGVALRTAVEADQFCAADFDEFEMPADDRRAERLGSVETLIGIVRIRSGLWSPSVAQDRWLWQGRTDWRWQVHSRRGAAGRRRLRPNSGEFGPIWYAQSRLPAWMP